MKLLFLISFIFLIDLYFYFGVISFFEKQPVGQVIFKISYWLLSLIVYVALIYLILYSDKTTPSIKFNNNIIYSSLFFIFFSAKLVGCLPLITDDILRLFKQIFNLFSSNESKLDVSRLNFLRNTALFASGFIVSSMLLGIKFGRFNFKKYFSNISIKGWNSDYKIVHLSDLHIGSFNSVEKVEEIVNIVNDQNPDLIVFTGDLVNNYYNEVLPYVDVLKKLKAKDGKYSVLGNHDYCDYVGWKRSSVEWRENFENMKKIQSKIGFDLLLNDSRVINSSNNSFNIVGVENWGAGNFNKDGDLDKAMIGVDDKLPTILLSHDPSHWRNAVLKSKYLIDLQLSGHTHGMQFGIEIPGFKWSPVSFRYKEWAGLYKESDKQIYVNRGLGHLGYAGRVGIMPDISILNIKS